jgi:cellulose synthase/poly-beta-1,6-N-acetylglucosamine synthase-like glycosyltransferase
VSTPSSIFCFCICTVVFAYFGYPILIVILAYLFGRKAIPPRAEDSNLPDISILISAHNEEVDIEAWILNALAIKYPAGKLEIAIASDGSTDRTNEIIRKFADQGVRLFEYTKNRGKASALQDSIPHLRGKIVLFSDANSYMAPDAAQRLVGWFNDAEVGVVCGLLILRDPRAGKNIDSVYWKYENFLKKCESRLGALLGSNGAIYAIRKDLIPVIPTETLNEDFLIPLQAKRLSGCRIVYETRAIAREETPPTLRAEFRRRVRIGTGGLQNISILWPLLSPMHGWISLTFFCHKVLRWLCPFLLLVMLVTNILALETPLFVYILVCQGIFYGFSFLGNWIPNQPRFLRYFRLPMMFTTMNFALLFGYFRWLRGRETGIWRRTDRSVEAVREQTLSSHPVGAE